MSLIRVLQSSGPKPLQRLLVSAGISAVCTTGVLAVVSFAAKQLDGSKEKFVNLPLALAFVVILVLYLYYESRMISSFSADIEEAVDLLRVRLVGKIRHADLWKLEHFGRSQLYESITQSSKIISANSQYLALSARSVILIFAIMIYIAVISKIAFLLLAVLLCGAWYVYRRLERDMVASTTVQAEVETMLFERVSDLLDGFKEQRLSSTYSETIGAEYRELSARTVETRSEMHRLGWRQFIFSVTTFHVMFGLVVFVLPVYSPEVSQQLFRLSAAVLFMMAPLFGYLQSMTVLRAARDAAAGMMRLDDELSLLHEPGSEQEFPTRAETFGELRLEGVEYTYPANHGETPFTIGPLDVTIRRGETVFVTGGNGSGKSTFLRLLTGLYHPDRGILSVDNRPVTSDSLPDYRLLIAPVFSDFHLFSELFGFDHIDPVRVDELLQWMEIRKTTGFSGRKFNRINLSTGQRKRLAFIAALLEGKPILVLDEWAADQDSEFRKKFYREILPELHREGLTIIAVTHDDRYFDTVGRRIHLEEGQVHEFVTTDREPS